MHYQNIVLNLFIKS